MAIGAKRRRLPAGVAAVLAALTAATATAQDDLRDRVVLVRGRLDKDNPVVKGRVLVPTAGDELLVLQGGKRVRIPRAEIESLDLVGDRIREFCKRRTQLAGSARGQWFLVQWAESHELPGLARAQATLLALDDDNHAEAHEFLGHRQSGNRWLWPFEGRHLTLDKLEQAAEKKAFELVGERFAVRCDGRIRAAVAALLDLETLGVEFYERFGEPLRLEETLVPCLVDIKYSTTSFEKWGFRPLPYYKPPPHGDVARTFYAGVAPTRPERLFYVGTEALLYHALIGEVDRQSDRDRVCAWLEVGLGMVMENLMGGPAGFAAAGNGQRTDVQALQALDRQFRVSSLLHLPMYGGFYLVDDTPTAIHWASAAMFVTWLLEEGNQPPTRTSFLAFVRKALGEKKGDSSSLFDEVMGRRIEELEEPWSRWLVKQASK
ncbi:MAG: hypothetical protein KDE27_02010 [Planctomycetes bacterium]|nr:hypothetical protein [Planctomycetota bacterium]